MQKRFTDKFDSFYFIGIGGVSMSGLAKYIYSLGKTVAGSDVTDNGYTTALAARGIRIITGSAKESVAPFEVVVYTDAIRDDDVQLCEARRLGKEIISRGQLLYEISRSFKTVIAVSGCHGKTTCTAMLAHIFGCAGIPFAAQIGGKDTVYSNSYYCGNDFFICEACEYKKNFLLLRPDIAVILNSAPDHLECYGSAENLRAAYVQFASGADVSITNSKETGLGGLTFGTDKNADYRAKNISDTGGTYAFTVCEGGGILGDVRLNVYGRHNVLNALAATAAARSAGIAFRHIKRGLESFSGVERRFERIGSINGADCIADYAHHPDEIRATVRTAKKIARGSIYVVFQPHTYSRTKNLFKEFVSVLSAIPDLMIYRTFAAREYFDETGSALRLYQSVKKSRYGEEERDIADFIASAREGDMVLFLGAGDIYDIARHLLKNRC